MFSITVEDGLSCVILGRLLLLLLLPLLLLGFRLVSRCRLPLPSNLDPLLESAVRVLGVEILDLDAQPHLGAEVPSRPASGRSSQIVAALLCLHALWFAGHPGYTRVFGICVTALPDIGSD